MSYRSGGFTYGFAMAMVKMVKIHGLHDIAKNTLISEGYDLETFKVLSLGKEDFSEIKNIFEKG